MTEHWPYRITVRYLDEAGSERKWELEFATKGDRLSWLETDGQARLVQLSPKQYIPASRMLWVFLWTKKTEHPSNTGGR